MVEYATATMSLPQTSLKRKRSDAANIASSLGICVALAGCSPPANVVPITPVATQAKARTTTVGSFLGAQSCAAGGCHGQARDGSRDWQSAYSVWFADDPHRRAGDVLYAERSVEIYRSLHPLEHPSERTDEVSYSAFVQARCAGCHTIPATTTSAIAVRSGVSCEACHGPASGWIDQHYLTGWKRGSGFRDLKNLPTRAAVCTSCHVGPVVADGITYDVDHELIAAGHPRLAFELDAYLTNYPKHWNEAADHARFPGTFHSNAWLCGQQAASAKLIDQLSSRRQPGPEFASYDCFDCHHALRVRGASRTGFPRPALLPLTQLAAVTGNQAESPLHSLLRQAESHLERHWTEAESQSLAVQGHSLPAVRVLQATDLPAHAGDLRRIPASWTSESLSWDQVVQFYLAVQAFSRDLPAQTRNPLADAAEQLAAALGPQNFGGRLPTQYDSPATFDPSTLTAPLADVDRALADIATPSQPVP
jgi:hypothetical protein